MSPEQPVYRQAKGRLSPGRSQPQTLGSQPTNRNWLRTFKVKQSSLSRSAPPPQKKNLPKGLLPQPSSTEFVFQSQWRQMSSLQWGQLLLPHPVTKNLETHGNFWATLAFLEARACPTAATLVSTSLSINYKPFSWIAWQLCRSRGKEEKKSNSHPIKCSPATKRLWKIGNPSQHEQTAELHLKIQVLIASGISKPRCSWGHLHASKAWCYQTVNALKQLPLPSPGKGLQGFKHAPFVSQRPLKAAVLDKAHP